MKTTHSLILSTSLCLLMPFTSLQAAPREDDHPPACPVKNRVYHKPRVINTTDLGADPDDEQSMVRQLVCSSEFAKFLGKLRLYDILGQDDAGAWIAKNFPDVFYIRATGVYGWQPSDEYLDTQIQNHGPLGAVYPDRKWATEGDSPSFMQAMEVSAPAGSVMELSAADSGDPDGHSLTCLWSFYDEPSSCDGSVTILNGSSSSAKLEIPGDAGGRTIHVILEVHDNGTPNLYAYRRLIVNVQEQVSRILENFDGSHTEK